MTLLTLNGALIGGGLRRFVPTLPAVAQDRKIGASMNSLWSHAFPYQVTALWLDRLADADGGKTIQSQGTFDVRSNNPPNWNQNFGAEVATIGLAAPATWAAVDAANVTDVVVVTDNFQGPPAFGTETNPRIGGNVPIGGAGNWVDEITDSIITGFEANVNDEPTYWIYEGWADGGSLIQANGSATTQQFTDYRARTTGIYGTWFSNLVTELGVDTPAAASRIKLIPVARTMVSVMENTAASSLVAADWFEDDAPHGRDVTYLLAGMICYTTMFQQQAPTPSFTGATLPSTFTTNYTDIAAHIATQIGV